MENRSLKLSTKNMKLSRIFDGKRWIIKPSSGLLRQNEQKK